MGHYNQHLYLLFQIFFFLILGGIPDSLASAKVLLQDWNKYDSFIVVYLFVYLLPW